MSLQVFQQLAGAIIDDPIITGKQREDKIVRLADLCNFIENYDPSIEIVDHDQFSIVEGSGTKKAIFICDFSGEVKDVWSNADLNESSIAAFKEANRLMEVWLVIIEEGIVDSHLNECRHFIKQSTIPQFCDKVFHFNYADFLIIQLT